MIQFAKLTKAYQRDISYITLDTWNVRHITTGDTTWKIPSHMFGHYTLLFLMRGRLSFNVSGKEGVLEKSCVICAAPGMQLEAHPASASPCDLYIAEFDCSDFVFFDISGGYAEAEVSGIISEHFYHLNESAKELESNNYVSDALLLLILKEIGRRTVNEPEKQNIYDEVRKYIVANVYESLSVETVATAFMYSKDYLGRIIKQCGGMTIKKMIIDEKLGAAKNLLITTTYSAAKISALLHFGTPNDFLKFFKYHTNISPAAYRRKYMA